MSPSQVNSVIAISFLKRKQGNPAAATPVVTNFTPKNIRLL